MVDNLSSPVLSIFVGIVKSNVKSRNVDMTLSILIQVLYRKKVNFRTDF